MVYLDAWRGGPVMPLSARTSRRRRSVVPGGTTVSCRYQYWCQNVSTGRPCPYSDHLSIYSKYHKNGRADIFWVEQLCLATALPRWAPHLHMQLYWRPMTVQPWGVWNIPYLYWRTLQTHHNFLFQMLVLVLGLVLILVSNSHMFFAYNP